MRSRLIILSLWLMLAILFISDLLIGSVKIPISEVFTILFHPHASDSFNQVIILEFRLPKALTALLAGIALSISGLQMQTIFRNPLAGPDVLGISSGASFGVALMVLTASTFYSVHFSNIIGNIGIAGAACIGAAATMLLILTISSRIRDVLTILILGLMIGSALSAIVSILQFFSSEALLKNFVIWTLGSLSHIGMGQLRIIAICACIGLTISFFSAKMMDALLLGERYAATLGVNVKLARIMVFSSTSILAGSITAFCGPIAFIGIIVPHISRMLVKGAMHKKLIYISALVGANIMILSDIISQLPGSNLTLPVNSITALLGIPVVVWIVIKNYKN